jgi:hypothetical protein
MIKTAERVQVDADVPSFWVVINPTKDSTYNDIVFKSNLKGMMLQVGGGMRERDIASIYKNEQSAKVKGHKLLHAHGIDGCPVGQKWNPKTETCVKN